MKMKLKPSKSRDHQRSSSESSTKQEVGQGDEPTISSHVELSQPVVDGVLATLPDGVKHEGISKDSATSESREPVAASTVSGPAPGVATSSEATDLK